MRLCCVNGYFTAFLQWLAYKKAGGKIFFYVFHGASIITSDMKFLLPYIYLARLDRPIGTWLLLLPCWWGVLAASSNGGALNPNFFLLFALGALLMRAAGCVYNDLIDHNFDAQIARTKTRPLPMGSISRSAAVIFLIALSLSGFLVLIQFNRQTIILGFISLALVAIYPFMKRITYMPQFFLGLAFGWGVLMGWAAIYNSVGLEILTFYIGTIFWIIGYDTIYALQDKEGDLLLGLKSSALLFANHIKPSLRVFYFLAFSFMLASGFLISASLAFYFGLALAATHLSWQIISLEIESPDSALKIFKSNRDFGIIILASLAANHISSILTG